MACGGVSLCSSLRESFGASSLSDSRRDAGFLQNSHDKTYHNLICASLQAGDSRIFIAKSPQAQFWLNVGGRPRTLGGCKLRSAKQFQPLHRHFCSTQPLLRYEVLGWSYTFISTSTILISLPGLHPLPWTLTCALLFHLTIHLARANLQCPPAPQCK
jgi:hypothetical protein